MEGNSLWWLLHQDRLPQQRAADLLYTAGAMYGGPPRFWASPSYLYSDSANRVLVIEHCVVVLRAKVLHGRPVLYLLQPPLPLPGGTYSTAKEVLAWLHGLGVGCKVSGYDMGRYGILDVTEDKANVEYTYTAGPPRTGRAGRHERNARNRLDALQRAGTTTFAYDLPGLPPAWSKGCVALAKRWYKQVRRHQAEARVVAAYAAGGGARMRAPARSANLLADRVLGQVVAYSLTEGIAPGQAAIVARLRDYTWVAHPDPLLALHSYDLERWPPGTLLTIGAAVGSKGLLAHKQKLPGNPQPLQLCNYPGARTITLDEWRAANA